ncbi:MAG: hypothetical protein E6Q62_06285 [Nitrosomonas sp.]|nr:MAG: hypothetical protein E6Q62_06285 [Nitrosomonas sp.]
MNDEQKKIVISRISEFHQNESGDYQRVPVSPVNRWITYAMLIPVIVVLVLIGVFFFAAFLALLAVAIAVLGVRFWWLRRKYTHAMQEYGNSKQHANADQEIIIEDAQVIEETEVYRKASKK